MLLLGNKQVTEYEMTSKLSPSRFPLISTNSFAKTLLPAFNAADKKYFFHLYKARVHYSIVSLFLNLF
ncbi:MAG: hypothetical protein AUK54_03280 [Helicobacteraceae bacterium CG2_30_36_10]|nr:MAG: hypothetical protein AUK54_03280 [Helicobacteraceae bacterium CG2_30_36_10]